MIRNYLKITYRYIVRNKLFAVVNITGLSISLACCMLLFLYTTDELSFEKHQNPNVYRISSTMSGVSGEELTTATASVPIGPVLKDEIPEIENQVRIIGSAIFGTAENLINGEKKFTAKLGSVADSSIFNVLKFHFLKGNPSTALIDPKSVVLDTKMALKLFGDEDPIGKLLEIEYTQGKAEFIVSAIIDNDYYHADFNPDYIVSIHSTPFAPVFINNPNMNWMGNNLTFTYLQLAEGASPEAVEAKIDEVFKKYGKEDMEALGFSKVMHLININDIHFDTSFSYDLPNKTSMLYIKVIISIGILILFLACVNYVNLSTAQAGRRALEVGVRKAMGVSPWALKRQFLFESFIIVFIATLLSLLLVEIALPYFNTLAASNISIDSSNWSVIAFYLVVFLILTVFLAGLYPAIYLSRFNPATVLKSRYGANGDGGYLRKFLVIFQFIISISLITGIVIITQQFQYIKKSEKGFNTASKLVLTLSNEAELNMYEKLRNDILALNGINSITGASSLPGHITNDYPLYQQGKSMEDAKVAYAINVDHNYIPVMEHKLVSGRNFSSNWKADQENNRIIISKNYAEQFGFTPETAIGEKLQFDWTGGIHQEFEVIGVMSDFNFFSLHQPKESMMYMLEASGNFSYVIIDFKNENYEQIKASIGKIWSENIPDKSFEPQLLDDNILAQYEKDYTSYKIAAVFAILSIFISCMGLYALSVFIAERKHKEIGIRKAMGATLFNIIFMVSSNLSKMIIIAFVISIPLVWFAADKWLSTFNYHIDITYTSYLFGGVISILISWFTISFQSVKAAKTNPATVLKED